MPPLLARILKLRCHPSRGVRLGWWAGLLALGGLVAAPHVTGSLLGGAWLLFNLGLLLAAVGWAVFHPRALVPALRAAGAGSFWLALLGTIWISSSLTVYLSERMPEIVTPLLRAVLVLGSPVLWVGLLAVAFGLALIAASIGVFATRQQPRPDAASLGAGAGWLVLVGLGLLGAVADLVRLPEALVEPVAGSAPAAVALLTRKGLQAGCDPAEIRERSMEWLARLLIRRWQVGDRSRRLDLRGPALGLVVALSGAVLAFSPALLPLQARVLVAFSQLRNTLEGSAPGLAAPAAPNLRPVRVALLELDPEARREATTTGSEAGMQARIIRKLAGYGATIVLPLPAIEPLNNGQTAVAVQTAGPLLPLPTDADVRRTLADLDGLVAACRASGSVYLSLPFPHAIGMSAAATRALKRLSDAAAGTGRGELASFGASELPVLSAAGERPDAGMNPSPLARPVPSLPLLLTAGPRGPDAVRGLPQIAPGKILVSVRATQPEQSFPRVSYGSVLRGEPLFIPAAEAGSRAGRWVSPSEFFRGRTVFLASLLPHARDTVAGRTPQAEVLAHALATLHARVTVGRAPLWGSLLVLLLAGLITGTVCAGRDPLQASWIAGAFEVGALTAGAAAFLAPLVGGLFARRGAAAFSSVWLDPVAPMLVVLATYLLTANLTLAVERAQRVRNKDLLQRFVAPQVVQELLDEMEDFGGEVGLGGTRQSVCVLFADVRGFTRFAEAEPPEVVIEVTNHYLTALTEALRRHGGLLDKYLGDGLMALFRVHDPRADLPRAVRAALAMRDAAAVVSAQQAAADRPVLQVGLSLHFGEAVVGLVGNPAQFNYTALGHTVVVSQRLQSVAGAGEVILSETVFAAVQGQVHAEPGTPVFVKGLSQPVRYYRIPNPLGLKVES